MKLGLDNQLRKQTMEKKNKIMTSYLFRFSTAEDSRRFVGDFSGFISDKA